MKSPTWTLEAIRAHAEKNGLPCPEIARGPSETPEAREKAAAAARIRSKADLKAERDLQNQIASWLRLHDIWTDWDAMNKRRTGTKGTPDFLFSLNGCACALEAKFGDGKTSPDQDKAIAAMRANGWRVAVVRSLEEVIAFLAQG